MNNFPRLVFLGTFFSTAALVASAQLVQWTFDDPGSATFLTNSGSLGAEMDLRTFISSNPDPLIIPATATRANLQSTNTPGDVGRSLDLTSTTAMKAAQGAYGNIAATTNNVSGLTAMTITGWFNASAAPSSGVQLIRANTAANNGWVLSFYSDRQMRLNIGNGTTATNFNSSPTAFAVSPVGVWQFFAISWNSTVGHTWYAGSPTTATAAAGTGTALATMNANPYQLSLGRSNSGSGSAFYGYLDDIRIYNTALTVEQVEALRLSNLAALPAPSALQNFRTAQGLATDGSQDLATPAGDGVANLLKYAFNMIGAAAGQASTLATATAATLAPGGSAGLPAVGVDGTGHLTLTYIRRLASASPDPGIVYQPEFADALNLPPDWAANPAATVSVTPLDATFERVLVTDSVSNPARCFVRVRVTAP